MLALRLGGKITARQEARIGSVLAGFRGVGPFQHRALPYDLARIARQQVLSSGVYCRTADRLHLAAVEALGLRRLLTNDEQQAAAARALGFGVLLPREPRQGGGSRVSPLFPQMGDSGEVESSRDDVPISPKHPP